MTERATLSVDLFPAQAGVNITLHLSEAALATLNASGHLEVHDPEQAEGAAVAKVTVIVGSVDGGRR